MYPLFLLASFFATAQTLPMVEPCSESEHLAFLTGDQVYLRAGPSADADIVAAIPWGTCVVRQGEAAERSPVAIEGLTGFIAERFLSPTAPERSALDQSVRVDRFCRGEGTTVMQTTGPGVSQAIAWNNEAGLPGYYVRGYYDDYCDHARPGPANLASTLERGTSPSLNLRLASWTLAFAPESAYRQHPSVEVLQHSPLFRPFPGLRNPAQLNSVYADGETVPFHRFFGSQQLAQLPEPPPGVHLLHIAPESGRIRFLAGDVDNMGVAGGEFPSGTFQLAADLTVVQFGRDLPAALLDPCTGEFLPAALSDIHYELGTGELSASVPPAIQARLEQCRPTLPRNVAPTFRFVVLIDESPEHSALASVTSTPTTRVVAHEEDVLYGVEQRWSVDGQDRAFLRAATQEECGLADVAVFQFYDETWQAVVAPHAYDSNSCGA